MSQGATFDEAIRSGIAAFERGDYAHARSMLERGMHAEHATPRAFNTLALAQRALGDTAGAKSTLETATLRYPRSLELWINRAILAQERSAPADALEAFDRALLLDSRLAAVHFGRGIALTGLGDVRSALDAYEAALRVDPNFVQAHFGAYQAAQTLGENANAIKHQRAALAKQRLFHEPALRQPPQRTLLLLCAVGLWEANIPLDFLLDRETTELYRAFVDQELPALDQIDIPSCDLIFTVIAESDSARDALTQAAHFVRNQPRPIFNEPELVERTSRESIARIFAGLEGVRVAPIRRVQRRDLGREELGTSSAPVDIEYPLIIRPVGSHAGIDLEKVNDGSELDAYLERAVHEAYFLSSYIDYCSLDGLFRKYRIAYVDRQPFPVHLAVSDRWMIHYYNALMGERADFRAEEERFLADMHSVFDGERFVALERIGIALDLDYCGIDCTILPDGTVFVFEADVAMLVHMNDDAATYAYKHRYIPRIAHALERALDARIAGVSDR